MSRSYKKHYYCKEENSKSSKREANRAVRRADGVFNGSKYKKLYDSWDISDYRWKVKVYSAEEFKKLWNDTNSADTDFEFYRKNYNNWKDAYRQQLKWYVTK